MHKKMRKLKKHFSLLIQMWIICSMYVSVSSTIGLWFFCIWLPDLMTTVAFIITRIVSPSTFQSSLVFIEIITQTCNYRALNNGVLCILQVLLKFRPFKSAFFLHAPQKKVMSPWKPFVSFYVKCGHITYLTLQPQFHCIKKSLENNLSCLMMDLMECPPYPSSCFHPYLTEPFEGAFYTPSPVTNEPVHLWNILVRCFGAFHNFPRVVLPRTWNTLTCWMSIIFLKHYNVNTFSASSARELKRQVQQPDLEVTLFYDCNVHSEWFVQHLQWMLCGVLTCLESWQ